MRATEEKRGKSAAVRIPASVLTEARLRLEAAIEIRAERGRIVIEPALRNQFRLEDLLKGIRADNLHPETDFGCRVGD